MKVSQLVLPFFIWFSSIENLSVGVAAKDVEIVAVGEEVASTQKIVEQFETKIHEDEPIERTVPSDDSVHNDLSVGAAAKDVEIVAVGEEVASTQKIVEQFETKIDQDEPIERTAPSDDSVHDNLSGGVAAKDVERTAPSDDSVQDILKRMERQLHEVINDRNSSRNSWRSWWIWKFIDYKSVITFALGYALKYYVDQISHHRRDFTDLITISWHFFEDSEQKKKKFFAAIEGSVSMQQMFQDERVLLEKVKLAVQTSFSPDYPAFVVLVGRGKTWIQVFRYSMYIIVTFIISVVSSIGYYVENILLCLVGVIFHIFKSDRVDIYDGKWCLKRADERVDYLFGNYFKSNKLYTPCRLDHTRLFLRRVITVVSEQTKNSLWSFEACRRSCNTSKENHHNPSQEKVLLFAICEKNTLKSEVLQLKIVLIFERDLLACLEEEYQSQNLEINYEPWIERVNNLKELAEIYKKHVDPLPNVNSSAAAEEFISDSNFKFWTEMELPRFPSFSHPVEVMSDLSSVRETETPLAPITATATSGTSSPPSSLAAPWTSPRGVKKVNYKI
jgi:hypothetical protein